MTDLCALSVHRLLQRGNRSHTGLHDCSDAIDDSVHVDQLHVRSRHDLDVRLGGAVLHVHRGIVQQRQLRRLVLSLLHLHPCGPLHSSSPLSSCVTTFSSLLF